MNTAEWLREQIRVTCHSCGRREGRIRTAKEPDDQYRVNFYFDSDNPDVLYCQDCAPLFLK